MWRSHSIPPSAARQIFERVLADKKAVLARPQRFRIVSAGFAPLSNSVRNLSDLNSDTRTLLAQISHTNETEVPFTLIRTEVAGQHEGILKMSGFFNNITNVAQQVVDSVNAASDAAVAASQSSTQAAQIDPETGMTIKDFIAKALEQSEIADQPPLPDGVTPEGLEKMNWRPGSPIPGSSDD